MSRLIATAAAVVFLGLSSEAEARPAKCFTSDDGHYDCDFKATDGNGSFVISSPDNPTFYIDIDDDGETNAAIQFGTGRVIPLPGPYRKDVTDPACWVSDSTQEKICAW